MNSTKLLYENIVRDNVDEEKVSIERTKRISVWGCGESGREIRWILDQLGIRIEYYLDSKEANQGVIIDGIKVLDPIKTIRNNSDMTVIVAMAAGYGLVREMKAENGFDNCIFFSEYLLELTKKRVNILEIGPWSLPLFSGKFVKYCDIYTEKEIRDFCIKDKNYNSFGVPDIIDYVSKDGTLGCVDEKFEFVYSSHLIEHQVDLIRHFQNVERILDEDGKYLMAIPDKRYCFNYFSSETDVVDVLQAYEEKRKKHSLQAYLNMMIITHNDSVRHWNGEHGLINITKEIYRETIDDFYSEKYQDMHEWFFTPESFSGIIRDLTELELINLHIYSIYETVTFSNTFFAVLGK